MSALKSGNLRNVILLFQQARREAGRNGLAISGGHRFKLGTAPHYPVDGRVLEGNAVPGKVRRVERQQQNQDVSVRMNGNSFEGR
jgi:hypothetical protein